MKIKILITGANSQLARCVRDLESKFQDLEFKHTKSSESDITNLDHVSNFFSNEKFDWCINCAAYTAVDKAETDAIKAHEVNVLGSENLAKVCDKYNTVLIHISTDFVFDGTSSKPYKEISSTNPLSVYGSTKLKGEQKVQQYLKKHFIIRTSWLYSEYGNNFLKTMLKVANDRNEINVVADQVGVPTYAIDLAKVILKIIETKNKDYGIYHYSNEGVASWYDFAVAIFDIEQINIKVVPITTQEFPTLATRPNFAVLDKAKIKATLKVEIPYWRDSLKLAISNL